MKSMQYHSESCMHALPFAKCDGISNRQTSLHNQQLTLNPTPSHNSFRPSKSLCLSVHMQFYYVQYIHSHATYSPQRTEEVWCLLNGREQAGSLVQTPPGELLTDEHLTNRYTPPQCVPARSPATQKTRVLRMLQSTGYGLVCCNNGTALCKDTCTKHCIMATAWSYKPNCNNDTVLCKCPVLHNPHNNLSSALKPTKKLLEKEILLP